MRTAYRRRRCTRRARASPAVRARSASCGRRRPADRPAVARLPLALVEPRVAEVVVLRVAEPGADRLRAVVAGGLLDRVVTGVRVVGTADLDRGDRPPVVLLAARDLRRALHRGAVDADHPVVVGGALGEQLGGGRGQGHERLALLRAPYDVTAEPPRALAPGGLRGPEPRPADDGAHHRALVGPQELLEPRR